MLSVRAHFCILVASSLLILILVGCGGGSGGGPVIPPNPTPSVTSVSPSSATVGAAGFTLTVTGTGFTSSSSIQWNGSVLTTAFVSSTSLQAAIPTANLITAGSFVVTVVNPAPGGGSSNTAIFTVNAPNNPVPAISAISPASATAGGSAFTLTVTGSNFLTSSQIAWNGSVATTMFASSTSLIAQITAEQISHVGEATVTVLNPAPGGGPSNSENFSIDAAATNLLTILNLAGNDLAWDRTAQKIYVSVPAAATANATTITTVDPFAGKILNSTSVDSEASMLTLSDDNQFLYAIIDGDNSVARYALPALTPDIKFKVGSDPIFGTSYFPIDVKPQPGHPRTVSVIRSSFASGGYGDGGVLVYDDATVRPTSAASPGIGYSSAQWSADGSALFVEDNAFSNRGFYSLAVNAGGITLQNQYSGTFRQFGTHLHIDPQTSYVYSDPGEIVNASNGLPIGNYPTGIPAESHTLSVVDPALKRVFFLTPVSNLDGTNAFQLFAYDQLHLKLLGSLTIPGAIGTPANFVRWGQSGLAFVTKGLQDQNSVGQLYLLDGIFVNPSGALDSSDGSPFNLAPTVTSLSPLNATVGSSNVTVTFTGLNFLSGAVASWNGSVISTNLVSSTEIQAQIPAASLAAASLGSLTITNPAPGGGVSNATPFTVEPMLPAGNQLTIYGAGGNDLVWDSSQKKIYISSPGIQGVMGNSLVTFDPAAGTLAATPFIGSDPAKLAISQNNQFLYVGLNGQNTVQRLTLPALTPDISWPLGGDSFLGPYFALDLAAAPGAPNTLAIDLGNFDVSPSADGGITIYDNATPRPVSVPGWGPGNAYASIVWGKDSSSIYSPAQEFPTDLYALSVDGNGITLAKTYPGALQFPTSDIDVKFDNGTGLLYTDGGQVVIPTSGTLVATFAGSGLVAPDSTVNEVFFLGQTAAQLNSSTYTLASFNQKTFAPITSLTIPNVVGAPTAFIRWGTDGLAFTTRIGDPLSISSIGPGMLYIISGTIVSSAAAKSSGSH